MSFSQKDQAHFARLPLDCRPGFLEEMRKLLEEGMPPDAKQGRASALLLALTNQQWKAAHLLLDHGADPNERSDGLSALHWAVRGKTADLQLLERLLDAGLEVNENDNRWGWTPLALVENLPALGFLLERGGDPNIPWHQQGSKSPISIIVSRPKGIQLALLEAGFLWPEDSKQLAVVIEDLPLKPYKLVTEHGLPLDRRWGPWRPVDWAVWVGDNKLLRHILKTEEVELNSPPGKTMLPPLHSAICEGNPVAVRALLAAGADPLLELQKGLNRSGNAFDLAQNSTLGRKKTKRPEHPEILALLEKWQAQQA